MKNKFWLQVGFFHFILIAIIGLLIRLIFAGQEVGFPYKNLVHAHSHVGFLGWVSMAIFVGLIAQFTPDARLDKTYQRIFIVTEISILGMLFSFPVQGYGLYSISFSTLYLLASYWFAWVFYKELKKLPSGLTSVKFAKAGLFYLVLSSLGPWGLGPVMATGHGKENIYYLIIFFYLHFLYNGAIIMAFFAMIFKSIEDYGLASKRLSKVGGRIFLLTNMAVIPTYLLSTLWTKPPGVFYWVGGGFALVQIVAFGYFLPFGKKILERLRTQHKIAYRLLSLSGIAFTLKLIFQLLSAFPFFVNQIATLKSTVVMGYIHLVTLGIISLFLIGWFLMLGGFSAKTLLAKVGIWIFVIGVLSSESLLFGQGVLIWTESNLVSNFAGWMAGVSSLMPFGLILFLVGQSKQLQK